MQEKDNNYFFNSKFMVPSRYELFKFDGISLNNDELGLKLMLQYFSKHFTEEQIKESMQRYNLENMFNQVKGYFLQEYGYTGSNIELNNLYQSTVNSYIYNNRENPQENSVVHIDELFESAMVAFFIAMFKWSKNSDDLEVYKNCFLYVLFLMNSVCILGEMQGDDAKRVILEMVEDDLQILQLAEDCYWTVLVFTLSHEVAHAYLADIGKKYEEKHPEKEELDADAIAYNIVLKIIMAGDGGKIVLEPYTYLAPMMYMDFFGLIYYTDRILYKVKYCDGKHPALEERKSNLFDIVNKDEYDFDTEEGNALYSAFCDVYDEFKTQVFLKMRRGKLDKILLTEKRNRLRREV